MRLTTGHSVGPYAIESLIGSGGMGEVYKARDTRLGRLVAIKTAKEHFSDGFQREARAISSLNHPRICTLYDVGPDYLVMEYVDGKPLKGPLPTDKAITYALQILDALDAAHRRGIVHRDLKPGNVLVTASGVKLLDFGLAKIRRTEDSDPAETQSLVYTGENIVLGTPQYMAPEQIAGEEADARSDIFAFGCVFYELLTGEKAFGGDSPRTVMAAIVTTEPRPVRELKPDCPPAIQFVLNRCFHKDRGQRWQSAHDLKLAIETALQEPRRHARTSRRWPIAVCIIAVALATTFYFIGQRLQPHPATRLFTMQLSATTIAPVRISPDGQSIAVVNDGMLTIRRLDSVMARPVTDSHDATYPFWSPDSQQIAFFSGEKLKRAGAAGGQTLTLAAAPEGQGGAWWQPNSGEGFIVFAPGTGGLSRVGVNGGQTTPVTERAEGENRHRQPEFLPDGRLLYTVDGAPDRRGLVLASLDTGGKATNQRLLLPRSRAVGYVEPDLLVFAAREGLMAQRFDLHTSQLLGLAFPISTAVTPDGTQATEVSISTDGRTAAFTLRPQFVRDLVIVNRDGSRKMIAPSLSAANLRLSPDSNKLALTLVGESMDVWIHDLQRDTRIGSLVRRRTNLEPRWSIHRICYDS